MPDTIPVGKYYNFDNKNVDVVYNPAKDDNKAVPVVVNLTIDGNRAIADKTVAEIHSAAQNGCVIFVTDDMGGEGHLPSLGILESIKYDDASYNAYIIQTGLGKLYARTESDYPGTAL